MNWLTPAIGLVTTGNLRNGCSFPGSHGPESFGLVSPSHVIHHSRLTRYSVHPFSVSFSLPSLYSLTFSHIHTAHVGSCESVMWRRTNEESEPIARTHKKPQMSGGMCGRRCETHENLGFLVGEHWVKVVIRAGGGRNEDDSEESHDTQRSFLSHHSLTLTARSWWFVSLSYY